MVPEIRCLPAVRLTFGKAPCPELCRISIVYVDVANSSNSWCYCQVWFRRRRRGRQQVSWVDSECADGSEGRVVDGMEKVAA